MTYTPPIEIFENKDLEKLIKDNYIESDIVIRGELIHDLGNVTEIIGDLGIRDSSLNSLGELKKVDGNFWISSHTIDSNIHSLNKLEEVNGDLTLRYSNIRNLGQLKRVNGNLSLRDTGIEDLGLIEFIGGNLFLPNRLENKLNLEHITIIGKIRFWNDNLEKERPIPKSLLSLTKYEKEIPYWKHNYRLLFDDINLLSKKQLLFYNLFKNRFLSGTYIDLEGYTNYSYLLFYDLWNQHKLNKNLKQLKSNLEILKNHYPNTTGYVSYVENNISNSVIHEGNRWRLKPKVNLSIASILEFEKKIKKEVIIDSNIIKNHANLSRLTKFGINNIEKISTICQYEIRKEEKVNNRNLLRNFFNNGEVFKLNYDTSIIDYEKYSHFFDSRASFEYYLSIDKELLEDNYIREIPIVVEKAISYYLIRKLRESEDIYRESIGMPKIGQGWLRETELFYKISNHYNNIIIEQHSSPFWLGRQHFDVYIPEFNISLEYQGIQHYKPVDFFGGKEAFEKTKERDKRKFNLCKKNNCHLIYVNEGYSIETIFDEIDRVIKMKSDKA